MSYCRKPGNDPITLKENKIETNSVKIRRCLGVGCSRPFLSQWAGERICPDCKKGERFMEGANPFEDEVQFGHH